MNIIIVSQLMLVLAIVGALTGTTAVMLRRKFTTWFFMGACVPFISCVVLLCLYRKIS
jgi:hypothetical protein